MHDDVDTQKISRLIDADLSYDETLALLKKLQSDVNLKAKMCRYQAISQALKTDEYYQVKPDFSDKVFQKIQHEPVYFLPQLKPQTAQFNGRNPQHTKKMFAVAASTLAAVVLVGQSLHDGPSVEKYQTLAEFKAPTPQLPTTVAKVEKARQNKHQPLNAQFNDYLQAHNSSVYTNGEANFQPYATVTSYGQR